MPSVVPIQGSDSVELHHSLDHFMHLFTSLTVLLCSTSIVLSATHITSTRSIIISPDMSEHHQHSHQPVDRLWEQSHQQECGECDARSSDYCRSRMRYRCVSTVGLNACTFVSLYRMPILHVWQPKFIDSSCACYDCCYCCCHHCWRRRCRWRMRDDSLRRRAARWPCQLLPPPMQPQPQRPWSRR